MHEEKKDILLLFKNAMYNISNQSKSMLLCMCLANQAALLTRLNYTTSENHYAKARLSWSVKSENLPFRFIRYLDFEFIDIL